MEKIDYTITEEKDLEQSEKEFSIEVSAETLSRYRATVLKEIVADAEFPGFRKGKAPEAKVLSEVGEMTVLEKAAERIVNETAFSVIGEKKLRFIGQPRIAIKTLAPGNPLHFSITVTVAPEVTLPDYKKIAAEINNKEIPVSEVTDAELNEALENIKKMLSQETGAAGAGGAVFELTDESVKKLGGFENLEAFKQKLREDLLTDKKSKAKDKKMLEIIEAVIAKTPIALPAVLIEQELDQLESEFEYDLKRMGKTLEDYLKNANRTREDLKKDWKGNAEKRAKFELIFPRIVKEENLTVPREEVEKETKHLLEHQPDAQHETAKLYMERVLLRQKVLRFLAEQKG